MAGPWRTISVALRADASGYTPVLRVAASETERFGKTTQGATKNAEKGWLSLSNVMKGGAVVVGLALLQAGRSAIEFEARMRNVASLGGVSEKQLKSLGEQVLELSKQFPQSANDLAAGLYDIASSGFQGEKGMQVLTASAKAASAGLTSTANSAQAITAVLNAYGLGADKARSVSDSLFQTVNYGVVNFEQLTGVIGDVVGTAAAARVGIDQVGAAIATMTRSGISADEAGTSLNRLLQGLIKPSDSLKKELNDLGYANGEAALKSGDLAKVIGQLDKASKGSITTMLQWFPEIRAARGLLALTAADGRTYRDAIKSLDDAHKGEGATERAFAEQMKSTQAQLKLLVNDVNAAGIALGTKFLPYITGAINKLRDLGNQAVPWLNDRLKDLEGLGSDVATVLGEMRDEAEPAAHALLTIGGAGVLGGFTGLLKGASGLTGELGKHPAIIHAITIGLGALAGVKVFGFLSGLAETAALKFLYLGDSLGGVTSRVKLFGSGLGDIVAVGENARAGIGKIGQSVSGLTAGLSNATIAAGAFTAALILIEAENAKLDKQAAAHVTGIVGSTDSVRGRIQKLQADADRLRDAQSRNVVDIGPLHIGLTEGDTKDAAEAHKQLIAVNGALHEQFSLLAEQQHVNYDPDAKNARSIERQLLATDKLNKQQERHTHVVKATKAADDSLGVSRKAALSMTDDELQKLADLTNDMAAYQQTAGLLGPIIVGQKNLSVEALKDLADKAKKYLDDVSSTFSGYGDIIGKIGNDPELSTGKIEKFYTGVTSRTRKFLANIKTATARGLDPQFTARLLQAGPEQAGPLLQQLVGDNSKTLIGMVNDSETQLRNLNQQAVEMARLTNIAVNAQNKQTADDLSNAMKTDQLIAAAGGNLTGEALAKGLGVSVADVERIAKEYGFVLAANVNPFLNAIQAAAVKPKVGGYSNAHASPQAEGGYIGGPDVQRDIVPAMLMPGEVVVRRSAVKKFGAGNLLELNRGRVPSGWQVPGFADGGMVPKPPDVSAYGNVVGYTGDRYMNYEYRAALDFMKKATLASATGGGGAARALGKTLLTQRGWAPFWGALDQLWTHESGWNPTAQNPTSSAFGIPQFLDSTWASVGGHKTTDPRLQIQYGLAYIAQRYGNPGNAWNFWQGHHYYGRGGLVGGLPMHSYDKGGYLPPGLSLAYNGTGRPEPVNVSPPNVFVVLEMDGEPIRHQARVVVDQNNVRRSVIARKGVR